MTLHWMYIVQLVFRGAQPKFLIDCIFSLKLRAGVPYKLTKREKGLKRSIVVWTSVQQRRRSSGGHRRALVHATANGHKPLH